MKRTKEQWFFGVLAILGSLPFFVMAGMEYIQQRQLERTVSERANAPPTALGEHASFTLLYMCAGLIMLVLAFKALTTPKEKKQS